MTGFGGLTGHDGILPRFFSALIDGRRVRLTGLSAFLETLAQRPRIPFAKAGTKYTARSISNSDTPENNEQLTTWAITCSNGISEPERCSALSLGKNG